MAHLYQVSDHPEYEGYFTFDGIRSLEIPSDFSLLRDDGENLLAQTLYESPEEEALNADRTYHLADGREIKGNYTLKELQQNPELLENMIFVWTVGYPEWMAPLLFPEIEAILIKYRAKMPPPIVSASQETAIPPIEAGTPPPFGGENRAASPSPPPYEEKRKKNVWEHFQTCFDKKYLTFTGRASRAEFWSFVLFCFIFRWSLNVLFPSIHTWEMFPWSSYPDLFDFNWVDFFKWDYPEGSSFFGSLISSAYALTMFLPSLAVTVRRLHDTNHSPWWLLLLLLPVAGWIIILIFMTQEGQHHANQYGTIPDDYVLIGKKNR